MNPRSRSGSRSSSGGRPLVPRLYDDLDLLMASYPQVLPNDNGSMYEVDEYGRPIPMSNYADRREVFRFSSDPIQDIPQPTKKNQLQWPPETPPLSPGSDAMLTTARNAVELYRQQQEQAQNLSLEPNTPVAYIPLNPEIQSEFNNRSNQHPENHLRRELRPDRDPSFIIETHSEPLAPVVHPETIQPQPEPYSMNRSERLISKRSIHKESRNNLRKRPAPIDGSRPIVAQQKRTKQGKKWNAVDVDMLDQMANWYLSWEQTASWLEGRSAQDCREHWYKIHAVEIGQSIMQAKPWTHAEDQEVLKQDCLNNGNLYPMDEIFLGRNVYDMRHHWDTVLCHKKASFTMPAEKMSTEEEVVEEGDELEDEETMELEEEINQPTRRSSKKWSDEDLESLKYLVMLFNNRWVFISNIIKNRAPDAIRMAWHNLVAKNKVSQEFFEQEDATERPWNSEEDYQLGELVRNQGPDFSKHEGKLNDRTRISMTRRWRLIRPKTQLKDRKYTKREDELLISLIRRYGKDWTRIVKEFPSRTRTALQKHYASLMKN